MMRWAKIDFGRWWCYKPLGLNWFFAPHVRSITSMKAAAMATNADILLMMLQKDADRYLAEEKRLVRSLGHSGSGVVWNWHTQGVAFIRSRSRTVQKCLRWILTHGGWWEKQSTTKHWFYIYLCTASRALDVHIVIRHRNSKMFPFSNSLPKSERFSQWSLTKPWKPDDPCKSPQSVSLDKIEPGKKTIQVCLNRVLTLKISGWWFQIFFIFTPTWGRFPFWRAYFSGVETTNQSCFWIPGFQQKWTNSWRSGRWRPWNPCRDWRWQISNKKNTGIWVVSGGFPVSKKR